MAGVEVSATASVSMARYLASSRNGTAMFTGNGGFGGGGFEGLFQAVRLEGGGNVTTTIIRQ